MPTKLPRHGYVASIDNPTSPQNISSSLGNASIDPTKNMGTVFTADTRFQQTVEGGGLACNVNLQVIRTTGVNEAYNIFSDWYKESAPTSRTLTIDWPNSNSGSRRLTGEFSLQQWQEARREPGSGEAEVLEAVLTSDGTYSITTI